MGSGVSFKCKKCGEEYSAWSGIGFLFPKVYSDTLQSALNGEYGEEWKELLSSRKYIKIDAEKHIYLCKKCGNWKSEKGLSLYIPKDFEFIKQQVAPGLRKNYEDRFESEHYEFNLDTHEFYDLLKEFTHTCDKCGETMEKQNNMDIDELKCPYCGEMNHREIGMLHWDQYRKGIGEIKEKGICEFALAKNNTGSVGVVKTGYDREKYRFYDL